MAINVIQPSRAEIAKCLTRFADLIPCNTGVVDMQLLAESERTFLNVLGFSQPKGDGQFSPFSDLAPAAITHLRAGVGMAFIGAKPGCGVLMHVHDTVETFMVMHGKWKVEWELDSGTKGVTLEPWISSPARSACSAASNASTPARGGKKACCWGDWR